MAAQLRIRAMRRMPALLCLIAATGCDPYPQLDAAVSDEALNRDFPAIIALRDFEAQANSGAREQPVAGIPEDRVADLHRRAAVIRELEPIPPAQRSRMLNFASETRSGPES